MRNYIIKRLIISFILLFFVAFLIYFVIRLLPTSYVEMLAIQKSQIPGSKSYEEWLAQLSAAYGMDKGIVGGFFAWLGSAIRLDFGDSWYYTMPVTAKFNQVIWLSFVMGVIVLILELIIAIPLGILAARKQYSKTDYAVTVIALAGISLPTFFLAALLKYIFAMSENPIRLDYILEKSEVENVYSIFKLIFPDGGAAPPPKNSENKN